MGTPEFSVPILESIHQSEHNIITVYTQKPKKKDRGQKIKITPVHKYAKNNNLIIKHPEELNSEEEINFFKKTKAEIVLVVAYGKILPMKLLKLKNIKFINIHASLLPKWRGAAPIQRSIMNLDSKTGISIMKIVPKLDAGPVMMKSEIKISKDTNFQELSEKLSKLGAREILKSLRLIENNKAIFVEQDEMISSYAKKIEKFETKINWRDKAKTILAKINALSPIPGAWFEYKNSRIKILKAQEIIANEISGKIINNDFTIACSENAIQVLELQKQGKKRMSVTDYLKGNEIKLGDKVE